MAVRYFITADINHWSQDNSSTTVVPHGYTLSIKIWPIAFKRRSRSPSVTVTGNDIQFHFLRFSIFPIKLVINCSVNDLSFEYGLVVIFRTVRLSCYDKSNNTVSIYYMHCIYILNPFSWSFVKRQR